MIDERVGISSKTWFFLAVFLLAGVYVGCYGFASGGGVPPVVRVASDDVSATASGGSSIAIVHGNHNSVEQTSSYTAVPTPEPRPAVESWSMVDRAMAGMVMCGIVLMLLALLAVPFLSKSEL